MARAELGQLRKPPYFKRSQHPQKGTSLWNPNGVSIDFTRKSKDRGSLQAESDIW
jgi:hypothetical protein